MGGKPRPTHWGLYLLLIVVPIGGWIGVSLYPALADWKLVNANEAFASQFDPQSFHLDEAAAAAGYEQIEYPTLASAVISHRNQLRKLGRAEAVMPAGSEQRVAVQS